MLHAILQGKLGAMTPDAERLEDAVTSAVFGTLLMLERWDVLVRWLSPSSRLEQGASGEMWFWPTLHLPNASVTPDVIARAGSHAFVVEAKYASARNDLARDEEKPEEICDQLVRQYMCIVTSVHERRPYPEAIDTTLAECSVQQIFLVDGRRLRRAHRELRESLELEPRMKVVPRTWQQLDRVLHETCAGLRWAKDLRRFLEIEGLSAFVGFAGSIVSSTSSLMFVKSWTASTRPSSGLRQVFSAELPLRVAPIVLWRRSETARGRWMHIDGARVGRVLGWRSEPSNRDRSGDGRS
jgi:hypothetical protein